MHAAYYVVLAHAALAPILASLYFRRYQVTRPPIGVFNRRDVYVVLGAIVLVPYLYLALPPWAVTALLALASASVLYFVAEPMIRSGRTTLAIVLVLVAVDIATALARGVTSTEFLVVNNGVVVLVVLGIANLWAQSGMRARHIAVLAGALAAYDFVATSQLTLMTDLVHRLAHAPLVPFVAWGGAREGIAIGLGDLLLAGAFPLVMRKAYGRGAWLVALATGLAATAAVLAAVDLRVVEAAIPVMVVLGPLMVAQYCYWARRRGRERTTRQYLEAEPIGAPRTGAAARGTTPRPAPTSFPSPARLQARTPVQVARASTKRREVTSR